MQIIELILEEVQTGGFESAYNPRLVTVRMDATQHAVWVLVIQILTSLLAYVSAKFAAKVCIQSIGFSLPLTLTTPLSLVLIMTMCGARASDKVWLLKYV